MEKIKLIELFIALITACVAVIKAVIKFIDYINKKKCAA
jgi:hypothetical protein